MRMTTQPLRGRFVTEGSVLILPAYPLAFLTVGLIFRFQSPERSSSPAFGSAKFIMGWTGNPIHAWGLVFVALALCETVAALLELRRVFTWCLVGGSGLCGFWATLLFTSAGTSHVVSYSGGVWIMLVAWAQIASVRSLTRDTVIKR